MKYSWCFLLLLFPFLVSAQWTEDFSEISALNNYPNSQMGNFIINGNEQLQLNATNAGFSQLQFPLDSVTGGWEFSCFVRQNFAGSANNFGRLALTLNADADSAGNAGSSGAIGLIVQWGTSGSNDPIQLFWDNGNALAPLASGFNIANGVYGQLKIRFDSLFTVAFQDNDSAQFHSIYTSDSMGYFLPQFLFLQSQYTLSNAQNFYWDDIYWGVPFVPALPIHYPFRSVVINEIMADPTPSLGCPEIEYIELYNASSDTVLLNNWKWVNTTSIQTFQNWTLLPFSFLVICDQQDVLQWNFPVMGLEGFLSLTNSGDSLTLLDATDQVVDFVHYNANYYHSIETEGGIALELIDPVTLCSGASNWRPSLSENGGTPGLSNSVLDMQHGEEPVKILDWGIDLEGNIHLWPSLPITEDSIALHFNNTLQYFPIQCGLDSCIITPNTSLYNGVITIDSLQVCHQTQRLDFSIDYRIPKDTAVACWVQEILFNPEDPCPSFVELYNPNNFALSLNNWKISNEKDEPMDIQRHHHFIPAKGVMAITEEPNQLRACFPQHDNPHQQLHGCAQLPYFTQSEGQIALYYNNQRRDHVFYNEEMHATGIESYSGKSLEKLIPYQENAQWLTASESAGYATPGQINSQRFVPQDTHQNWTLSPICFSPNGDGQDDFVQIQWNNAPPNEWVQWYIVNEAGLPIYEQQAEWAGNTRQWTWDGRDMNGILCPIGLYGWVVYSSSTQYQILPALKTFVLSP